MTDPHLASLLPTSSRRKPVTCNMFPTYKEPQDSDEMPSLEAKEPVTDSDDVVSLQPLPNESTRTEQVRQAINEAIVEGRLPPGSLHSAQSLARQLGVSRTPVREALLQLAREGTVKFLRNRGVQIMETSIHDLEEIFEIRLFLEVPATAQAVKRATPRDQARIHREFEAMHRAAEADDERAMWDHDRKLHLVILQASGNLRLAYYVDQLWESVLFRGTVTAGRSRTLCEIVEVHRPILEAVEAGDARRAAEEMRRHIRVTADLVLAQEQGKERKSQRSRG